MTEAERARITAHVLSVIASDGPDDGAVVEAMRKAFVRSLKTDGFMTVSDEGRYPVLNGCWDLDQAMSAALAAYRDHEELF